MRWLKTERISVYTGSKSDGKVDVRRLRKEGGIGIVVVWVRSEALINNHTSSQLHSRMDARLGVWCEMSLYIELANSVNYMNYYRNIKKILR